MAASKQPKRRKVAVRISERHAYAKRRCTKKGKLPIPPQTAAAIFGNHRTTHPKSATLSLSSFRIYQCRFAACYGPAAYTGVGADLDFWMGGR
jgi:hypothetical protein